MNDRRLFVDTAFIQAVFNKADQYHSRAVRWLPWLQEAREAITTEAVLVEFGNALSAFNRAAAASFIRLAYRTPNLIVLSVDRDLLMRGLDLYDQRPDKTWGLTDCISFIVMAEHGVTEALTADRHFEQAGMTALLLREPP